VSSSQAPGSDLLDQSFNSNLSFSSQNSSKSNHSFHKRHHREAFDRGESILAEALQKEA
jgi:hypothetical protein